MDKDKYYLGSDLIGKEIIWEAEDCQWFKIRIQTLGFWTEFKNETLI